MIGTLILTVVLAFVIRYYIRSRKRDGLPPGPTLRFPILGHGYYLFKGQIEGFKKLKEEYGKIFTVLVGPLEMTYVNEYDLCQEMMSKDAFNGRPNPDKILGNNVISTLKGGTGCHGLGGSSGDEWREQRKFALRHLREFGFGKASMSDVILEEWEDLAEALRRAHEQGEEVDTNLLFNLSALNVIWRIVSGKRYSLNDEKQRKNLQGISDMFNKFGIAQLGAAIGMALPNWLQWINVGMIPAKNLNEKMYKMFEDEYKEHEKTYDPNHMRDYIDVYLSERIRVNQEKITSSSFYGEIGRHNYRNSIQDLFVAGSETTSTTMLFFILFLLHHPSMQKELQDEIDQVVGRDQKPSLDHREQLPKVMAFISEVHRRATVVPFAVQHATLHATKFREFDFPENHVVVTNLALIMNDPEKFPNPDKFDPSRFIDKETGKYKPSPYMCQYGIGKRECLGMALAKNEQFIFLTNMLHSFTIEPSSTEQLPGVDDAKISITRTPVTFKARFIPRLG